MYMQIPPIAYNVYNLLLYCTVYKLLVTLYELLVTHSTQLVSFTVMLGEDKETVMANRNYNLTYCTPQVGLVR